MSAVRSAEKVNVLTFGGEYCYFFYVIHKLITNNVIKMKIIESATWRKDDHERSCIK